MTPLAVKAPHDYFSCPHLQCNLRAAACVARQLESEREPRSGPKSTDPELRRHDGKRGKAPEHVTCTPACQEGSSIRARLGDGAAEGVRHGLYHDRAAQWAAEAKQRPLDVHPRPNGAGGAPETWLSGTEQTWEGGSTEGCSLETVSDPSAGR